MLAVAVRAARRAIEECSGLLAVPAMQFEHLCYADPAAVDTAMQLRYAVINRSVRPRRVASASAAFASVLQR